ncbi:Lsr2 family DNA-binding protein [Kineococcus terrestris]|uniref:Lsr2 family DNA-binding protein n=1 Tax=Kineococcus terrestris TaxID=2044856 RepID=UPI0034DB5886
MRAEIAAFGHDFFELVDVRLATTHGEAWWGGSETSPLRQRNGFDIRRVPALLGELLSGGPMATLLPADDAFLGLVAHVRFECARYEQFEDPDPSRARRLLEDMREVSRRSRNVRAATPVGHSSTSAHESAAHLRRTGVTVVSPVGPEPRRGTAVKGAAKTVSFEEPTSPGLPLVPGAVVTGPPRGERCTITVYGDIVHRATRDVLGDAVGELAAAVLNRIRVIKPTGAIWVDTAGVVTTVTGDKTRYVTTVAPWEWFPGHVTPPPAPVVVKRVTDRIGLRGCPVDASVVRSWGRAQGYSVAERGSLSAALVRAYNAVHPRTPYSA